jgi:hypothetical protein
VSAALRHSPLHVTWAAEVDAKNIITRIKIGLLALAIVIILFSSPQARTSGHFLLMHFNPLTLPFTIFTF